MADNPYAKFKKPAGGNPYARFAKPAVVGEPDAVPWYTPITSLPGNARDVAVSLGQAIAHPLDTYNGMNDIVEGAARKIHRPQWMDDLAGTTEAYTPDIQKPEPRSPQDLQRMDNSANAFGQNFSDSFRTPTRAWNTIATHPIDALMLGAGPAGMASKAATASGMARTGAALAKAGEYANPVNWAAKPIGAAINTMAPQIADMPRMTSGMLRAALPRDLSKFDAMGPEAMMLDASPSTVGLAQGVSVAPGAAKNAIVDKLVARDKGRSTRLLADTQKAIGGAYDPELLKMSIDRGARKQANPLYSSAKKNAQPLAANTADTLARNLTEPAKGMALESRGAMGKVMTQIEDALLADTPKLTAERLHSIRKNLDAQIVYGDDFRSLNSADKAAQSVLKQGRTAVDKALKEGYPGFKRGDKIISTAKKAQDDIAYGQDVLGGGKTAVTPEMHTKELRNRDPRMVREGVKADIASSMGTQANDLAALKKKIGGENDWNRTKIADTFSPRVVDKLVQGVDREGDFARNYADVARNSQTAQRNAAATMANGPTLPDVPKNASWVGMGGNLLMQLGNKLLAKGVGKFSNINQEALTKALTTRGPAAKVLMNAILNPHTSARLPVNDTRIIKALIAARLGGVATALPK